jgi:DNA primase
MTEETIESYGLGYAPNSWEATSTYFQGQGYAEKDLIEAGLASERDSGGLYDRFRNRLMIPIRDRRGRMTGFGARTLDPDGVPKYLNSPQTDLFDKSKLLYGLDQARKAIRAEDQVIIVEGYLGVLIPHQHGFKNIVATMGTALTDDHLYKIKRYSKRIILAMDSDAAGVKATLRGLDVARETLDKETEFAFDARGLLRRESKLQADLRVATLPPGMDPDDVVNENPERWQEIIEQAQPILIHVMETLAEGRDLQDPKVKSEIAGQVLPLIDDVSNAIERDTYIQRLARMLEVDERTLLNARPAKRKAFRRRRPSRPPASRPQKQTPNRIAAQRKGEAYEAHCVGILLRHPELTYQVNRRLGEFGLARVSTQDFHQTKHQMLMELIQASLEQNEEEPGNYILNNLTSDSMDIADDLLSRTPEIDLVSDKVLKDLIVALLKLRRWHVEENNTHIRFLFTNEQIDRDAMSAELRQNTAVLHKIDLASQKYTSRTATVERK